LRQWICAPRDNQADASIDLAAAEAGMGLATDEQGLIYVMVSNFAVGLEVRSAEFPRHRLRNPIAQGIRVPQAFGFADFRTPAGIRPGSGFNNEMEWGVQWIPDSCDAPCYSRPGAINAQFLFTSPLYLASRE
jgi:hypothetical protein